MENLLKKLQEFDHKRFNEHYRNLIKIGQTAGELEFEMLDALYFIAECETMFERVKETLENQPDEPLKKQPGETRCPMCEAKEKTIQTAEKLIEQAEQRLKSRDNTIKTLEELKDEAMKALNSFTGKHLKVSKKEHFPGSERTLMGDYKPDAY